MAWEEEEVEEKNKQSDQPKKKGGSMKIILLLGFLIIIAGAGAGGYFFLSGQNGTEDKQQAPEREEQTMQIPDDDYELFNIDISSQQVYSVSELVVNLADPGGKRYLIIEVQLIVRSKDILERINSNPIFGARIKDTIIMTGSAKTFDDLSSVQGKMFFREELKIRFAEFIGRNTIVDVLFSKFVLS